MRFLYKVVWAIVWENVNSIVAAFASKFMLMLYAFVCLCVFELFELYQLVVTVAVFADHCLFLT